MLYNYQVAITSLQLIQIQQEQKNVEQICQLSRN